MRGERVFFYVQHLLGIGHLRRAITLANALAAKGLDVTLASGGFPVPGLELRDVRFLQLPPLGAADTSFKALVTPDGTPIGEELKAKRQALLLDAWRDTDPHALIVELFPFGRRQMRFELIPLLDAASNSKNRPVIVCSVRDVLGAGLNKPGRQEEMLETFERYFDHVLVHGDPSVILFDQTFMHTQKIAPKLHYTGYVVDGAPDLRNPDGNHPIGTGEVLVSVGGGAVGTRLLETAIGARSLSNLRDRTWRLLTGINASAGAIRDLKNLARSSGTDGIIIERVRTDFVPLLRACAVSVSQGGYNTMMEIVQTGARAVVVPFAGGSESEQTLRARSFAERGLLDILHEDSLEPFSLAAAIDRSASSKHAKVPIELDGASRTAGLVAKWVSELRW